MAPRRRRPKVGLSRMDGALDAMRPMGFPNDAVRKSVRKLLKVYGDDGWAFIEEAAYKLLIDTLLEEPEEDGHLLLEGCSNGSREQLALGNELCDKEETRLVSAEGGSKGIHKQPVLGNGQCDREETGHSLSVGDSKGIHEQPALDNKLCNKEATSDKHEEPSRAMEIHGSGIYCQYVKPGGVKVEKQDSGSEDVQDHKETEVKLDFARVYNPQPKDRVPKDGKVARPCYGWISDDEEDENT